MIGQGNVPRDGGYLFGLVGRSSRYRSSTAFVVRFTMSELSVYLIYAALCVHGTQTSCEFPEFVQTNRSGSKVAREWRGRIREQFTEFSQRITFQGSLMDVVDDRNPLASFRRQCVDALPVGDRYIVSHISRTGNEVSTSNSIEWCLSY